MHLYVGTGNISDELEESYAGANKIIQIVRRSLEPQLIKKY
jgi:hypothetical protein